MDFYEKNLEYIRNCRDFMYKSIKDFDSTKVINHIDDIHTLTAKNGEQIINIKYNNEEYRLNSLYNPTNEARQWADQYKLQNLNNIISVFGFGNGIFAREIIKKMGANDVLLIYEPCAEIFFYVMKKFDITDILKDYRVSISVEGVNEFEFHNSIRGVINITNINDQIFCTLPIYDKIFTDSCILFWKELKDGLISTKIDLNTGIYFGKRFIDNVLHNLKFIKNSNSLGEFKEDFTENIPAIIISAGPSVENSIEELKRAKGRSVIFAVDRILDYLLNNGIEPDFVVTLDPIKPIEYFTKRTDITIPLICVLEANKEILDQHAGKKIICNCTELLQNIYCDLKKTPPKTPSSMSVSTVAFSACLELNFKYIILVGQDLAFNGTYSHAGNIEEVCDESRAAILEDIHGNPIRSRYDWKEIVTWYQDTLQFYPGINVIDAKENGAKIKGTTVMSLKDAVNLYCKDEIDCSKIVKEKKPTFDDNEMLEIVKYLESNVDMMENIRKKSREASKLSDILINESKKYNMETKITRNACKKLCKINKFIEEQKIYPFMDNLIVALSAQDLLGIAHFNNDVKEDSLKTYSKSKAVFEAIIQAADFMIPKLEQSIDCIRKDIES